MFERIFYTALIACALGAADVSACHDINDQKSFDTILYNRKHKQAVLEPESDFEQTSVTSEPTQDLLFHKTMETLIQSGKPFALDTIIIFATPYIDSKPSFKDHLNSERIWDDEIVEYIYTLCVKYKASFGTTRYNTAPMSTGALNALLSDI